MVLGFVQAVRNSSMGLSDEPFRRIPTWKGVREICIVMRCRTGWVDVFM